MKLEQLFLDLEFDSSSDAENNSRVGVCDYQFCRGFILKNQQRVVQGRHIYHRDCYDCYITEKNKLARETYGN